MADFHMPTDEEIAQFAFDWGTADWIKAKLSPEETAQRIDAEKGMLHLGIRNYTSVAQIAKATINHFLSPFQEEIKILRQQVESKTNDCQLYLDLVGQTAKSAAAIQAAALEFVKASDDAAADQWKNDGACNPAIAQRVRVARKKLEELGVK